MKGYGLSKIKKTYESQVTLQFIRDRFNNVSRKEKLNLTLARSIDGCVGFPTRTSFRAAWDVVIQEDGNKESVRLAIATREFIRDRFYSVSIKEELPIYTYADQQKRYVRELSEFCSLYTNVWP